MANFTIKKLSNNDKGNEVLQVKVIIKNKKFHIYYNENLLKKLDIKEEEFSSLSESLEEIVDPSEIENEIELVSLLVINGEGYVDENGETEIKQEVKAKCNNKHFPQSVCKMVNRALLKDLFIKMGVDKSSIDEYIK